MTHQIKGKAWMSTRRYHTSVSSLYRPENSLKTCCVTSDPASVDPPSLEACMKELSCAVWSLKPKAVGATMSTSLVHCLDPRCMALTLFCLAAVVTSGTAQTLMPSRRNSLKDKSSSVCHQNLQAVVQHYGLLYNVEQIHNGQSRTSADL